MLAVLFVIRNRYRAGWQGGNWLALVQNADSISACIYPPSKPDLSNLDFRKALATVDDIYSGFAADLLTEGALYYGELNKIENPWFLEKICRDLENHPMVATVGNVSFFK